MKTNTKANNMGLNVINLTIDQYTFDNIMKGEQKEYCLEITPENERELVLIDDENFAIEDENGNCITIEYDAIRFFVEDGEDTALVRIEESYSQFLIDEDGMPITYLRDPKKSPEDDSNLYYVEEVVYVLGEIIK